MKLTNKELDLIDHALGAKLEYRQNSEIPELKTLPIEFDRNYFFSGDSKDEIWEGLVTKGYATFKEHKCQEKPMMYYYVSEKGMNAFRVYFQKEVTEKYKKPSKNRLKYLEWLHSESGLTFAEYLGIWNPKKELVREGADILYLFKSTNPAHKDFYGTNLVFGQPKKTAKEAKESYKKSLLEFKNRYK